MAARSRPFFRLVGFRVMVMALVALSVLLAAPARLQATPFAAVVMDARTGEILHAVNHDTRLHPASLTKMMTLYVAFEAIQNGEISLDTMVRISPRAAAEPPSRLGLRAGQRIALRHLIRAAALRSGNDAATAIAEAVSGSVEAFAARMNRTAAAIGMSNTHFRNAHGLTQSGHLSTARDMTILGRQLLFDYPQYYNIFSRRAEDAGVAQVRNTNSRFLDAYRGADGIKTGFTNAAGYNLTASAERGGVRIIVTVFGGRSVAHRHEQVVQLMDRGFRQAPARVAVRRPPRPDYSAAPLVASAGGEGRAAARVIRLQTAPSRSPFPMARPDPLAPQPAEPLLAALQSDIASVLAEVAAAPDRSPLPAPRPEAEDAPAADLARAEAAGFSTISAEEYLDLTSEEPEDPPGAEAPLLAQAPEGAAPEAAEVTARLETGTAVALLDLPASAAEGPAPRPEGLAPEPLAVAALDPPNADPLPPLPPAAELLASVVVENGLVVIPGLPPIAVALDDEGPAGAGIEALPPVDPVALAAAPVIDSLSLGEDGRILWRDEELIAALGEGSAAPEASTTRPAAGPAPDSARADAASAGRVPDMRIVLTAGDATLPPPAYPAPPMPEIVTRVSTSGGRLWAVNLGQYPSRFDAERVLLRLALSESTTLGTGVRRVGQSGGRYVASILSLTQDQAELACLRLNARNLSCEVIHP